MIPIMALKLAEGMTILKVEEIKHTERGEPLRVRIYFTNNMFTDISMEDVHDSFTGRVKYSHLSL